MAPLCEGEDSWPRDPEGGSGVSPQLPPGQAEGGVVSQSSGRHFRRRGWSLFSVSRRNSSHASAWGGAGPCSDHALGFRLSRAQHSAGPAWPRPRRVTRSGTCWQRSRNGGSWRKSASVPQLGSGELAPRPDLQPRGVGARPSRGLPSLSPPPGAAGQGAAAVLRPVAYDHTRKRTPARTCPTSPARKGTPSRGPRAAAATRASLTDG